MYMYMHMHDWSFLVRIFNRMGFIIMAELWECSNNFDPKQHMHAMEQEQHM